MAGFHFADDSPHLAPISVSENRGVWIFTFGSGVNI